MDDAGAFLRFSVTFTALLDEEQRVLGRSSNGWTSEL